MLIQQFYRKLPVPPLFKHLVEEYEACSNVLLKAELGAKKLKVLEWLLSETFEKHFFGIKPFIMQDEVREIGPNLSAETPWSSSAVSACHSCGITEVMRIEMSRRYKLKAGVDGKAFEALARDRMREAVYENPLTTFNTDKKPEPVKIVCLIEDGKKALEELNREMGLGLDAWDIDYYYNLFVGELKRNPTNVECFDLSQSNSEHSRHWFFNGKLVIDDVVMPETLMQIVKAPWRTRPGNSVIAFRDNSSAIRGYKIITLIPATPGRPSEMIIKEVVYHITLTAETHNFPTGVCPFPGAETGTGGRIRDGHATGRGSLVVAGTAAYCVGNLNIPDYPLPWERPDEVYPGNLAPPLQIEIDASNGASDYGNKFGEPVIQGFTRSFGLRLPDGERREWIKPIMFTGGVGQIDDYHTEKGEPEKGMLVVKIGGPAYRIGMGGGGASSMIQGENVEELDFNAVQRGNAEMEQKVNRVIRGCVELGYGNPIVSIHDQGAGGNCNVVKELISPAGAAINIRDIIVGDKTLSALEIWGAEYQEQDGLLIRPESEELFRSLCEREKVPVAVIGYITGSGRILLIDSSQPEEAEFPLENLPLNMVLDEMPQKTFNLKRLPIKTEPLVIPNGYTILGLLELVLSLLSVGSKRFLTSKVDRSVTGLIARQQCAGPLQLTVSDVAVIAQSHFGLTGAAISIGEQPIKGLIDPAAMARMSVGEALTNMASCRITGVPDIRCSVNWMWAPKLPGEGARMFDAACAMRDIMLELGIAPDGGKDSLSMAAKVTLPSGDIEIVKSPGTLVISAYAPCPDITKVITPDIKQPGKSKVMFIDLGIGRDRLGGSALAHVLKQVGDESPDVEDPELLKDAFYAIQEMIRKELILSYHDRSDGGLITTLLEMAFSGNCGLDINFKECREYPLIRTIFSEELGMAIEYLPENETDIIDVLNGYSVPYEVIAKTTLEKTIALRVHGEKVFERDMRGLRAVWEETSHRLDMLQANPDCVIEEKAAIYGRPGPQYKLPFTPEETPEIILKKDAKPSVAIIREEGSNGDREMASAFYLAGLDPWDVMMTDLLEGRIDLKRFKGLAFVGGFSYADTLGSAKGWAATIRFRLKDMFENFYHDPSTFSLSICNGCQLAALLGWVPWHGIPDETQPRFIHNKSGRFESRYPTVKILPSPSIMLKGMEGLTFGIWSAHGEGRAFFPDGNMLEEVREKGLAPIRYVDDLENITENYPFNPNGSPYGIAGLCTPDGRHLAMMPHPERVFKPWQFPWLPEDLKRLKASPWLKMFQNAREWCDSN